MTYLDPLRDVRDLVAMRQDMGVDYGGSGPIYAIGPAEILQVSTHTGWPGGGWINYIFLGGPASGTLWYTAENIVPAVRVGQHVDEHTVICTLRPDYPHCEMGWAAPPQRGYTTLAAITSGYREGQRTALGVNASDFLVATGAPEGQPQGRPTTGYLPQGWPTNWAELLHPSHPPYPNHLLMRGVRSRDVLIWKRRLWALGFRRFQRTTSRFGSGAEKATVGFQEKHGLHKDGIVGPDTWAAAWS